MVFRALLALAISSCAASLPPATSPPACPAGHAFVILVRHAEKVSNDPDAELSPEGALRARRLAVMLGNAGVTQLVATDVKRTQQTLAPLAERLGRTTEIRPAREVEALARELRASPDGSVVVVAHHSNGIPRLMRALGVEPPGIAATDDALPENDYGRVVVLSLGCDRARASFVQLDSSAP
ncbi:MAG: histidine phosphatase family protein [Labilithrix sp.]|nr:histidine phosphatase family protein [Labilithrix sp.]